MPDTETQFWNAAGRTSDYNREWKERIFKHVKKVLRKETGGAGPMIVDVGSGPYPVSRYLAEKNSRRLLIDINPPWDVQRGERHIRRNVRDMLGFMRSTKEPFASTIVFSDILNYIPYEHALQTAYTNLISGGCIVVVNQPGRTFDHAAHILDRQGLHSTHDLEDCVTHLGMHTVYADTTKDGYFIGVYKK